MFFSPSRQTLSESSKEQNTTRSPDATSEMDHYHADGADFGTLLSLTAGRMSVSERSDTI
jgi:hypothetical protein